MTVQLLLLVAAVALVGYANGANDNFKSVATIYGSSTLSYRAALGLATAAQLTVVIPFPFSRSPIAPHRR